MIKNIIIIMILTFSCITFSINDLSAQEQDNENVTNSSSLNRIFQFSIWGKSQLFPKEASIKFFRLNTVYGHNKNGEGFDIGGFGRVDGNFSGWQMNLINIVDKEVLGFQTGIYNSAGTSKSIQIGVINTAKKSVGWQIGIINHAEEINGFQIGLLYNTVENLKGLQIGLINLNWSGKPITCMPIINFSF